jgi:hypothetical protein
MMKKIDKLGALDTAIEAERAMIAKLQLNCQRSREEARRAEETQGRLAYKALGEGEAQAQAALVEAEELLSKSQSRARSSEIALAASQGKLESLQSERQQLFLEQKRAEYAAQAVELIRDDAEQLESALQLMSAAREGIRDRLKKMEAIALQAGIDTARTHNRVRENLRHAVECRGQFESVWLSKENRETFKQPVSTLLQQTLKSVIPEIEEERKIA